VTSNYSEGTTQALLRRMFDAAIASARPALCIKAHLPAPPAGRLIVMASRQPARPWFIAGLPFGEPGTTHLLRIATA